MVFFFLLCRSYTFTSIILYVHIHSGYLIYVSLKSTGVDQFYNVTLMIDNVFEGETKSFVVYGYFTVVWLNKYV